MGHQPHLGKYEAADRGADPVDSVNVSMSRSQKFARRETYGTVISQYCKYNASIRLCVSSIILSLSSRVFCDRLKPQGVGPGPAKFIRREAALSSNLMRQNVISVVPWRSFGVSLVSGEISSSLILRGTLAS